MKLNSSSLPAHEDKMTKIQSIFVLLLSYTRNTFVMNFA